MIYILTFIYKYKICKYFFFTISIRVENYKLDQT